MLCALAGLALCGRLEAGRGWYAFWWLASFGGLAWTAVRFPAMGRGRATFALLTLGLVLRFAFVWAWPADSDVNRYIVEGALQTVGGNPYLLAPGDPGAARLLPEALRPVLARVNHPELSAAYPPLAELYCRLVAAISPTRVAFQTAAALADWGVCLAVAVWVWRTGRPAALLLLCVANPLSLAMAAGEGHCDAVAALGVALAMGAFASRRDRAGFFLLGAAAMVKYPAALLIPFFLHRSNARQAWAALLPLAFFMVYASAGGHYFTSLAAFAGYIAHGGPVAAGLRPLLGGLAPWASLFLGAATLAVLWLSLQDDRRGPIAGLTVGLACLPTLYPWYFLPVVPLFSARPGWAYWWLLAGQCLVTTPSWLRAGGLGGEGWAMAAVWLPFVALTVLGWRRPLLLVADRPFAPVARCWVVIPARNEADRLGACLTSLAPGRAAGTIAGVVVADGGSSDATAAVAAAHGARVVAAMGGRGGQIAAAVAVCPGEAVLVVHADAVCRPDVPERVLFALNRDPRLSGGAVGMDFSGGGFGLWGIAALNALRARATGISFGDQGQFFRREALDAVGGFPDMALMEDVELALKLREAGETASLGGGLTVSARRWAGRGFGPNLVRVLTLFIGYLLGRRLGLGDPTGVRHFRRYYGRPPHQTPI
ncbi:glycosyltransferase [Solidesulfovibrio fructosivorans]|uniref:glycosyltransferase n=1 Tax=Solidesulfovibrio fructosivorans TaxID=878 RepID=UPI001F16855A|nr:glycosyltransferase [Solidesulfovibrio fructosivorans]